MGSILKEKGFSYAVRIVRLHQYLTEEKHEFTLSKQLLRSGTSVGAMIREAQNAESTADFIHKMAISQKECDESSFWLELLKETDYLTEREFDSIYKETQSLLKMIRSAIITSKKKMTKSNNS